MTAFAERFRNEGLEQGLQKGRAQGFRQGQRQGLEKALLTQLQLKFGSDAITQPIRKKIEHADDKTLLRWLSNILSVQSIEEIFNKKAQAAWPILS